MRLRIGKRGALNQLGVEFFQVRVGVSPVDVGKTKVQIAQGDADSDVSHRKMSAHAIGLVTEFLGHEFEPTGDLALLAGDPVIAFLPLGALGFLEGRSRRFADTIGQGFPAFDFGALTVGGREQLVVRGDVVDVFDNDPRIKQRGVFIKHQDRNLAQGVECGHLGFFQPRGIDYELVFDLFFCQHDAYLAHKRAGMGADQLHYMLIDSGVSIIAYG